MKTHSEFIRYLEKKNPELLILWNQALSEFYYSEEEE
jgi:hypothetical protein